jgi:hypothetical protein
VAAVLIALVLIRVSLRLIQRSHDFLVGVWAGAAGGRRAATLQAAHSHFGQLMRRAYEPFSLRYPGVTAIRELLFTFVGPGRVWIVARVDIDDGVPGAQVKAMVRGIEAGLKHESESVYRADIMPIGGPQALP